MIEIRIGLSEHAWSELAKAMKLDNNKTKVVIEDYDKKVTFYPDFFMWKSGVSIDPE